MQLLCNKVKSVEGLMGLQLELGEVEVTQSVVVVLERGWVLGRFCGWRRSLEPTWQEGRRILGKGQANLELGFQMQFSFEPGDFYISAGSRIRARHQGESISIVKISLVQLAVGRREYDIAIEQSQISFIPLLRLFENTISIYPVFFE